MVPFSWQQPGPITLASDNLHHYFKFRDGKIAYYRGTEDTAQTETVLRG